MQGIQFIGMYLDSVTARTYLPLDSFVTLPRLVGTIHRSLGKSIRNCLKLLCDQSRLCCIQGWLRTACCPTRDNLDRQVAVPLHVKNSLNWWKEQLHVYEGIRFCHPTLLVTLTSDASLYGWRAHLCTLTVQGKWMA